MKCIDDLSQRIPLFLALLCSACPSDDDDGTEEAGVSDDQTSTGTTTGDATNPSSSGAGPSTTSPDSSDSDPPETGSDETDSTPADTGGDSDTDATYTVTGSLRQLDLQLWEGNDGIGAFYLAMFDACNADPPTAPIANAGGEADLSSARNSTPFEVGEVPSGTWYIVAFLDDNGNADPKNPAPDVGDLVLADGFDPGCVEVVVDGADVTDVDVALNFVLPF